MMLTRPSSAPDRPIAENELFSTYSTRQSNDSLLPSGLCVGLRRRSDTQLPPYQNLYRLDSSLPFADREKGPRTFPLFFFSVSLLGDLCGPDSPNYVRNRIYKLG